MAPIWLTIVDMGGNPSKMENAGTPPPKNNAPKNNAPKNNSAPRNNAPKNNAPKNNAPKNNAPKNNAAAQRNNGASSPHLPEEEEEPDLEAGVGNASVTGTVGSNNRSRRSSNVNGVEPEVAAVEVDPAQTGGRRRSRKSRKSRKSRRSKRSY